MNSAVSQLRAAAPKLEKAELSEEDAPKKIKSALPKQPMHEVQNFLLALVREGTLDKLPAIIDAFEAYSGPQAREVLETEIVSAIDLDDQQRDHVVRELQQRYPQAELDVKFSVDESLIGGLVIRVGDQVLDNSLRSRLGAIQRNMLVS